MFFFKQKTAYEMRISDWSSDLCSSDLSLKAHCNSVFLMVYRSVSVCSPFAAAAACTRSSTASTGFAGLRSIPYVCGISALMDIVQLQRSEERRVGKECVSTCRSRWSQYH